jgi:phosphopantothenoylcysteine decarboxylase
MAKVLFGVTGSVAAIKTPMLFAALAGQGHQLKVVATDSSLYFFKREDLPAGALYTDADEWPRRPYADVYQREDPVLHIELRRWADLLLIAPLDANTLAKLAYGLCDNCLTCVWRAWDLARPVLLAPAMNTLMWENPQTARHLRRLADVFNLIVPAGMADADAIVDWINEQRSPLRLIGPVSKRLACGDVGMGAMAEASEIARTIGRLLYTASSESLLA